MLILVSLLSLQHSIHKFHSDISTNSISPFKLNRKKVENSKESFPALFNFSLLSSYHSPFLSFTHLSFPSKFSLFFSLYLTNISYISFLFNFNPTKILMINFISKIFRKNWKFFKSSSNKCKLSPMTNSFYNKKKGRNDCLSNYNSVKIIQSSFSLSLSSSLPHLPYFSFFCPFDLNF